MKLSKAQSGWVKQLVEESTSLKSDGLRGEEETITEFASAVAVCNESIEQVGERWPSTRPRPAKAASRLRLSCISTTSLRISSWPRRTGMYRAGCGACGAICVSLPGSGLGQGFSDCSDGLFVVLQEATDGEVGVLHYCALPPALAEDQWNPLS